MKDIPVNYRPLPETAPKFKDIPRNPVNPSIPSKWQTSSLSRHKSADGFGYRSDRFNDKTTPNPGPGYYHEDHNSLLRKSASLSKKGFGNAFVSKTERLSSPLPPNPTGPGQYHPKAIDEIYSSTKAGKFSESGKDKGRVAYTDPLKTGSRAGPGEYEVEANFLPAYLRSKPTVAFASQSGRDSYLMTGVNTDTPSPLSYNPNIASTLPERKIMWSKSQYKRFQDLGVDNHIPGPGKYFDTKSDQEQEHLRQLTNHRSVGRNPRKLLGKQNERPKDAIHTFGADVHRFKHSFLGRLDVAAETPGPGWYAPLQIPPKKEKTAPSPEKEDIHATGVFKMTGPKIGEMLRPIEHRTPGPAYYHPEPLKPKSYLVNNDSKWL